MKNIDGWASIGNSNTRLGIKNPSEDRLKLLLELESEMTPETDYRTLIQMYNDKEYSRTQGQFRLIAR